MQGRYRGILPVQFDQESGHAHGRTQFKHPRLLIARNLQGFSKTLLRRGDGGLGLFQQQFAVQSTQFRVSAPLTLRHREFLGFLNGT